MGLIAEKNIVVCKKTDFFFALAAVARMGSSRPGLSFPVSCRLLDYGLALQDPSSM